MKETSLQQFCQMEIKACAKTQRILAFKEWFYKNSISFTEVDKKRSLEISLNENCMIKDCYRNSWIANVSNRDLRYFEGFVISKDIPIPIQHSWLVNSDGKVIDPTLIIDGKRMEHQLKSEYGITEKSKRESRLGDEYFGMEIPIDFVNKMTFSKKITGEWLTEYFLTKQLGQVKEMEN